MASIEQYFTDDAANEGRKLYFDDQWLLIHGNGSKPAKEAARKCHLAGIAAMADVKLKDEAEKEEKQREVYQDCISKTAYYLVSDWSFDEECTPENVELFCSKAGWLEDSIVNFANSFENYSPEAKKK